MNSINIENIHYSNKGKKILENINFSIQSKEVVGLLGPNGAGKSTLLKIISGELEAESGNIFLNSKNISQYKINELAYHRSILFQESKINLAFNVKEIIELGRIYSSKFTKKSNESQIFNKAISLTRIENLINRNILTLSGGEKQRVEITRALAQVLEVEDEIQIFKFIILDEPISNLDINYQIQILELLNQLANLGFGIMVILHDLNLASLYCSKIALLYNGTLLSFGDTEKVLNLKNIQKAYNIELRILKDLESNKKFFIPKTNQNNIKKENINMFKEELKQSWENLKLKEPKIRIREAASKLAVSEMNLLQTNLSESVFRLKSDWVKILEKVQNLGRVMALTRNEACVHEKKGVYRNFSFQENSALFVGDEIDLRIFFNAWKFAFAVIENNKYSLQFFDKYGTAIHKIHLLEDSNIEEFFNLVKEFKSEIQEFENSLEKESKEITNFEPIEKDYSQLIYDWKNMQDTHDFFGILKKHSIHRLTSIKVVKNQYSTLVPKNFIEELLKKVSQRNIPIMVFVGNTGIIQIHTGEVNKIIPLDTWFNILDDSFNLHLETGKIFESYIVEKPTKDGVVTSLEVFDKEGELVVQFFGKRKPGLPELEDWRRVLLEIKNNIENETQNRIVGYV